MRVATSRFVERNSRKDPQIRSPRRPPTGGRDRLAVPFLHRFSNCNFLNFLNDLHLKKANYRSKVTPQLRTERRFRFLQESGAPSNHQHLSDSLVAHVSLREQMIELEE
ncbi:hypothetical protein TNCV_3906361 [Trichonephila clavipes]|nr:hypothetical protein TNCV_3906361 [Trichonephila clavipes]